MNRPAATGSGSDTAPLLVLLLDGVAHARMADLYAAGYFRRFSPPARLISVFPTLTDPAYDTFFQTGPTPGYEAGYFRRPRNRLSAGLWFYLSGGNERWVQHSDYRLNFIEDGLMYLAPRWVYHNELARARRVFDRRWQAGARRIVLYLLSTDALGHMLTADQIDHELIHLDAWIERLVQDVGGHLPIVMFSDHGISALPPARGHLRCFDLARPLKDAGLHLTHRLRRPGDAVMPLFGLLDIARLHTFDDETRDRAVAALRACQPVELVAAREGESVRVCVADRGAIIHSRVDAEGKRRYAYQPCKGDPLGLQAAQEQCRQTGAMDRDGYATWEAWLTATATDDFPAAVPRLWDGLLSIAEEQPDVIASLGAGWFVGSGLFNRFVRMHGTHGGLHRRVSETFAMATDVGLPRTLSLPALRAILNRAYGWPASPGGAGPDVASRQKPASDRAKTAESATIKLGDAGMGAVVDRHGPSSRGVPS